MPFADVLEDSGDFMMNWYVWVPCCGVLGLLLIAVVVTVVIVLVMSQGRSRRRRDDDD